MDACVVRNEIEPTVFGFSPVGARCQNGYGGCSARMVSH